MNQISNYIMPAMAVIIILFGIFKKVHVFDTFISGAKDGLKVTYNIVPSLVGLMVSIAMLQASGLLDIITFALTPIAKLLNLPPEVLPLSILRPISGSGSLALVENVLSTHGPDSYIGTVASVIQGSTETTFYAVAVYYGAVGVKNTRHTLPSALAADFAGIVLSAVAVNLLLF